MSDYKAFKYELDNAYKRMKMIIDSQYNHPNADKQQIGSASNLVDAAKLLAEMAMVRGKQ